MLIAMYWSLLRDLISVCMRPSADDELNLQRKEELTLGSTWNRRIATTGSS